MEIMVEARNYDLKFSVKMILMIFLLFSGCKMIREWNREPRSIKSLNEGPWVNQGNQTKEEARSNVAESGNHRKYRMESWCSLSAMKVQCLEIIAPVSYPKLNAAITAAVKRQFL